MEMLSSLNHLNEKIIPTGDTDNNIINYNDEEDATEPVPDDDAIKMFVGQVPRSMDEDALKAFFEEYGRVYQLNVLRDKNSGVSRGCCFVTFFKRKHALEAQNALHNVKTMPGMHHAIQMKPADTENRNERKIFVGMVSKKLGEEEVKSMFHQFGPIEDCTVLRDDSGVSRGCAFVTFANRQIAIVAIKAMHHSLTMEGCSSPLVVKFADTQKDKEHKKMAAMQTSLWSLSSVPAAAAVCPSYVPTLMSAPAVSSAAVSMLGSPLTMTTSQQQQQQQSTAVNNSLYSLQSLIAQQQQQQYLALQQQQQQHYIPHDALNGTVLATTAPDLSSSADMSQLTLMSLLQQQQSSALTGSLGTGLGLQSYAVPSVQSPLTTTTPGLLTNYAPADNAAYMQSMQITPAPANLNTLAAVSGQQQQQQAVNNNTLAFLTTTGGKIKTAEGTSVRPGSVGGMETVNNNLFIYHLPQEFTDADLVSTFQPFGTIVSAKVFIDKNTNLSKCFGFVSYTTSESAQAAIQAMNGFQVGTKRLKVQIKKPKDVSKPY